MTPPAAPRQAEILRRLLLPRAGGRLPDTVAVVGNAPLPESSERADRIDSADLVVRMTTFALDRGTPRVGTRTHAVVLHRALRPGPDTFGDHDRRLYLLAEPGRTFWEEESLPAWWPTDLELIPISNREFTSRTRSAMGLGRVGVSWPTTGTLTVHLMHRLFPNARILLAGSSLSAPDVVGDPRRFGRLDRHAVDRLRLEHQWGDAVTLTPEHRLDRERRVLGRWRRAGWLEPLA